MILPPKAQAAFDYIENRASEFCRHTSFIRRLTKYLLTPEFTFCSGSGSPHRHHYGRHGLLIHTFEVTHTCMTNLVDYPNANIDEIELFLSAIYHDAGKVFDYEVNEAGEWVATRHRNMIGHIPESCIIWDRALREVKTSSKFVEKYRDCVMHNILSHHGRTDWGSPVTPKSNAAWVLHLSDMTSAMLGDKVNRDN